MTAYIGGGAELPPLLDADGNAKARSATTTMNYGSHFHVAAALGSLFDSLNARPGYLASKVREHAPHQATTYHPSRGLADSNKNKHKIIPT